MVNVLTCVSTALLTQAGGVDAIIKLVIKRVVPAKEGLTDVLKF